MSFGLIWFVTKPKQIPVDHWPARPEKLRPSEIFTFGTKAKGITFGNLSTRPNHVLVCGFEFLRMSVFI